MTSLRSLASLPLFGTLPDSVVGASSLVGLFSRSAVQALHRVRPQRLQSGAVAAELSTRRRTRSRRTRGCRPRRTPRRRRRAPGAWPRARGRGPRACGARPGTAAGRRPPGSPGSPRARRPGRWPPAGRAGRRPRGRRRRGPAPPSRRTDRRRCAGPQVGVLLAIQPHFREAKVDALMVWPSTGGTRKPLPSGRVMSARR